MAARIASWSSYEYRGTATLDVMTKSITHCPYCRRRSSRPIRVRVATSIAVGARRIFSRDRCSGQDFLWGCTFFLEKVEKLTTFFQSWPSKYSITTAKLTTPTLQISHTQQKCPQKLDSCSDRGCTYNFPL